MRPSPIPGAQARPRHAGDRRQQTWLQQVRSKPAHAAPVLMVAVLDKLAETEAVKEHIGFGDRKIPAAVGVLATANHAEQTAKRTAVVTGGGQCAQRRRAESALYLAPRHVVDEEDDMPGFLDHQHVEYLEHALRQEFRLPRRLEGTKAEKAVHAFTETKIDECGLQIRR